MNDFKRLTNKMSYMQLIALGYFLIIACGTLLLLLPISANGNPVGVTGAFFTATSATCVTGLTVADTFTQWTMFGRTVIMLLIQVGGLGFMTIMALFSMLLGKKIGLRSRELLKESVNYLRMGGIMGVIRKVLIGTLIVEGAGAVLLSMRFIPRFGWGMGIYYGVFHAISAFCNAGFDLMGIVGPSSSMTAFYDDPVVNLTIVALILIGGIGFFVWDDVVNNKWAFKKYRLHSKLAILITLGLTVVGTVLIYILERDGLLADMTVGQRITSALFTSVTPRTAGFNMISNEGLSSGAKLIVMLFMAIGGNPGSTAGGIKTTTIAVLFITAWANIKNTHGDNVFGRRLEEDAMRKAATVIVIYTLMVSMGTLAICMADPAFQLMDVLFETISAASTVGMSTGITSVLSTFSQWVLILLMYCGRVGSVSFAMLFVKNKQPADVKLPSEQISIG